MSLLTKAKAYTPKRMVKHLPTKEEIEVAVAWAKDEIVTAQAGHAFGIKSPSGRLLAALKEYVASK